MFRGVAWVNIAAPQARETVNIHHHMDQFLIISLLHMYTHALSRTV